MMHRLDLNQGRCVERGEDVKVEEGGEVHRHVKIRENLIHTIFVADQATRFPMRGADTREKKKEGKEVKQQRVRPL